MDNLFDLKIINNGNIVKEKTIKEKRIIYFQDKASYSILLENNSNIIADVFLKIDGKKMGSYRIIPNEKYELKRPIRRKKELIFLKKDEEYNKIGLFEENNEKLGLIEAEFRTGVINIKGKEISNKKVFRPQKEGYIPEYMNIYKNNKKYKLDDESDESKDENDDENDDESDCIIKISNSSCSENLFLPVNKGKVKEKVDINNGFTVYGEKIESKFKTYHELLYDGKKTNININLKYETKYEKL